MPPLKVDEARGDFGVWLRRERKERFKNVAGARDAMQREAGYGIALSVWAELESGTRRPSAEQYERLTRFFGSEPESAVTTSADVAALVELVRTQTAELKQLWTVMQTVAAGLSDVTSAIRSETSETREGFVTLSTLLGQALGEGLEHMPSASESEDPRPARQEDQ